MTDQRDDHPTEGLPDWLEWEAIAERMRTNGADPYNCTLSDVLLAVRKLARAAASKEPRDIPAACDREWIRGASFGFQCGYDKALGVEGARERYDGAVEGRRKELAARPEPPDDQKRERDEPKETR